MRGIAAPQAGPQFSDFDGLESLRKNLRRAWAAKPQCPFAPEEIVDDLGQVFEAKRKFFAIEWLKLDAKAVKPVPAFFYFLVDLSGAQARLNAKHKAVAFGSPIAIQKFGYRGLHP